MEHTAGSNLPLTQAILHLRTAVDRLIDSEINRWSSSSVPAPVQVTSLSQSRVKPAPTPDALEGNPAHRLDLLAKRLDGRLRQARVPDDRHGESEANR